MMGVRADKYLWAVRIFKTRSMASDAIKGGKVKCNGENIKPARELKVGEELVIQLQDYKKTIRVKELLENRVSAKLVAEFMQDLTPEEEYKSFERLRDVQFVYRPRGTGRPSKKQRRDIEEWLGDEPA
jgi:ribosome-associated heat shock protein Hsp15